MKLQDFEIIKNRQRPDLMYQYKLKINRQKFQITTMNSGISFLATIESLALNGKTYLEDFSREGIETPEKCIQEFEVFNSQ